MLRMKPEIHVTYGTAKNTLRMEPEIHVTYGTGNTCYVWNRKYTSKIHATKSIRAESYLNPFDFRPAFSTSSWTIYSVLEIFIYRVCTNEMTSDNTFRQCTKMKHQQALSDIYRHLEITNLKCHMPLRSTRRHCILEWYLPDLRATRVDTTYIYNITIPSAIYWASVARINRWM